MSTQQEQPPQQDEYASLSKLATQWAQSPFPAWTFSAALLISPVLRPKIPVTTDPATGYRLASRFSSTKIIPAYPSNAQVAVFSAFVGLGGFMCFDNDAVDGQAVVGVWSLLYFLTNLKKSMWNFKVYPKVLTSLALVNSAFYSGKYLNII